MIERSGTGTPQSPWWYRRRSGVFGIIYALGFVLGSGLAAFTNTDYVPSLVTLGRLLNRGDGGILAVYAAGLILVLLAFLLRLWGSSYLQPAIVWNACT